MARAPKLKVYCAPMGFHDALVAAPSQKAALKAWGTTTDLFAAGRASIVEDPELQKLALARPGEVVKHSRGDEAAILQEIEATEGKRKPSRPKASAPKTKAAPPPDRSKLEGAERELEAAKRELDSRLEALARQRSELEAEERTARQDGEARIFELERARAKAARDYEAALKRHARS